MKSSLFKAMAIIMGMMMSLSLASCGDNNDENEPDNPKAVTSVTAEYKMSIGEGYQLIYDITATYTDENGVEKTVPFTDNMDVNVTFNGNKIPSTVSFIVNGKVKDSLTGIVDSEKYSLKVEGGLSVTYTRKDGTTTREPITPAKHTATVNGKHLKEYAANPEHATKKFYSETVKVKY